MFVVPSTVQMNALLGKTISEICTCKFHDANINHCAHFVSHVIGYQFGFTCFSMTGKGTKEKKANIRVQEVFPKCKSVGKWADKPATLKSGLVFITHKNNVNLAQKKMVNVPKKHIGIFIGDKIWHYSNTQDKVVTQTPEQFSHHYPEPGTTMYFGEFVEG